MKSNEDNRRRREVDLAVFRAVPAIADPALDEITNYDAVWSLSPPQPERVSSAPSLQSIPSVGSCDSGLRSPRAFSPPPTQMAPIEKRDTPDEFWDMSSWFLCGGAPLDFIGDDENTKDSSSPRSVTSRFPSQASPTPEHDDIRLGYRPEPRQEFSEKFNEAYHKGTLLPFFVGSCHDAVMTTTWPAGDGSDSPPETRPVFHLPLGEAYPEPSLRVSRRRPRRMMGRFQCNDDRPINVCCTALPQLEDHPSSGDAASRQRAANSAAIRRAPQASSSMSLPPGQASQIAQQITQSHAKAVTGRHVSPKAQPMIVTPDDAERIVMQQAGADRSALKELPALRDAPPAKREELFVLKLQLCSVIFSFDDPTADKRGKDMKRQTLLELVDYVNTPAGQKIFTESVMSDLMSCISANVCRALPPATDDFDPEEDEPVLEPAWPHLQVAYEFFLRFIVSSEVNAKAAKKYVDQKFCLQLVELFDSEDPRERDYLKTILHRIYGKFMSHRSFIRRAISNVFYRFVYETERHNGIGELLEILGSIINGFAIPLKKEHLQFLVRALIPLHKPKCVALYHQQLSYCIIQYVEKDADTATPILNGFFKCWPWSCSNKQVMFLNELEEILELLGADQLAQVSTMLFTNLARCLDSDHFQVVERALFLWNNEHLVNSGCLSRLNAQTVLPIIYGPLYKNSSGHWNATVEGLAQNVLKMYMEYDLVLYDKCTAAYFREEEEAKRKLEAIQNKWESIEKLAHQNATVVLAK